MRNLAGLIRKKATFRLSSTSARADKIDHILDELGDLNLLEDRFNIADISQSSQFIAQPAAAKSDQAVATPKPQEKSEFSVFLKAIDSAAKAKVIKEIKVIMPSLNLVEAKAFVESAPKLIKDKVKKEEAESMKKALEAAGATVTLE